MSRPRAHCGANADRCLRACSQSSEQHGPEGQVNERQAGVEPPLAYLDARNFLSGVMALATGRVRVFHALRVHDQQCRLGRGARVSRGLRPADFFNLKTAVGRARVGCDAVCWKGATTRRARARKAEQRRQRTAALPNRVRSAFTQKVMGFVCEILSVHQVLPAEVSGQLRFLGLMPPPAGSLPPCPARSTWQITRASCATFELASTDVAWISHASHPHVFFRRHQDREHALISSSPQSPGSTPSDNSPAAWFGLLWAAQRRPWRTPEDPPGCRAGFCHPKF